MLLKSEVNEDPLVYLGCSIWTLMNFAFRFPGRQASSEFPLRAQALLAGGKSYSYGSKSFTIAKAT